VPPPDKGRSLELHCPRCGAATVLEYNRVICPASRMEIPVLLVKVLTEIVARPPQLPLPFTSDMTHVGGRWCCPADGCQMVESGIRMQCARCDRCLPRQLLMQLLELRHPDLSGRRPGRRPLSPTH
jgi:hypothetical protein